MDACGMLAYGARYWDACGAAFGSSGGGGGPYCNGIETSNESPFPAYVFFGFTNFFPYGFRSQRPPYGLPVA